MRRGRLQQAVAFDISTFLPIQIVFDIYHIHLSKMSETAHIIYGALLRLTSSLPFCSKHVVALM
jgi:hypothetical protein